MWFLQLLHISVVDMSQYHKMSIIHVSMSTLRLSTLISSPSLFLVHLSLFHAESELLPSSTGFQFHYPPSPSLSSYYLRKLNHESVKDLSIPTSTCQHQLPSSGDEWASPSNLCSPSPSRVLAEFPSIISPDSPIENLFFLLT